MRATIHSARRDARSHVVDSNAATAVQRRVPLLYFPGMDGTGKLFYRQRPALSSHFDVRCLSLPTTGALLSWDEMLDLAIAHLPSEPAVLCGESFGGCWAMAVAARCPQHLAGLALINPASSLARQSWLHGVSQWMSLLPEWVYHSSLPQSLRWLLAASQVTDRDRERFLEIIRVVDKQTSLHRFQLLQRFRADELSLETVSVPALVIASARDRVLPSVAEARRIAARLPRAAVEILPDSGHACLVERNINLFEIFKSRGLLDALVAKPSAVR
ncbi:MAG: alpha/beta fold hydrolase [Cyanobacteria bacterium P01_D01_bin.123]